MPYSINDLNDCEDGPQWRQDREPEEIAESCPSCGVVALLQRHAILYDGNKVSEQSWLECESCGAETDCEELERLEKADLAKRNGKK